MLREIVGERPGHRILQQHLVGLQPIPVNGLHLCGVEVHRDDADDQEHAEDYVQNGDTRRGWRFGRRVAPLTEFGSAVDRSGGGFHVYL